MLFRSQIEMLRQVIDPKEQPDAKISMFTGCTANVLVIHNNKLFFANAGDSRSVLCKKGQAYPMSIDHKPSIPAELKRIERAEGWVSDGRILGNLNISRGIGDSEYKLNIVYRLKKGDSYVIGNSKEWVSAKKLITEFNCLNRSRSDDYSLDWKWKYDGNDENDTLAGINMDSKYKLNIRVYFEKGNS